MDIKSLLYGSLEKDIYEQLQQAQQDITELRQQIKHVQSEILQLKIENRELQANQKLLTNARNTSNDISWTEVTSGITEKNKIVSTDRITKPEVNRIEEIIQGHIGFEAEMKAILEHTAQEIDDGTAIRMGDALRAIEEDVINNVAYAGI